jgi:hypothetical protein
MKTLIIIFLFISLSAFAQRWQDENKGIYPNAVQLTINGRNTALGLRYSYLFQEAFLGMPVGLYGSFSQTVHPDTRFINYDWERKYSLGALLTLPKYRDSMMTMVTFGVVRNEHPVSFYDKGLSPGQHDPHYFETLNWGFDIGVQVQVNHVTGHIVVDALNFMRYVEVGLGVTFYKLNK